MPELPEVETIARQLAPLIEGQRVAGVEVLDPKLAGLATGELVGRCIASVRRRGKLLVLELAGEKDTRWLAVHLRMTGRLLWYPVDCPCTEKHLRARFTLERGVLLFCDARRFGTLTLHATEAAVQPEGIEPLSDELTAERLGELLRGSRQALKLFLLRQDRLTGLGNIYASEILFAAGLDPRRTADSLDGTETERLHRAIKEVLASAVEHRGTTFSDYRDAAGDRGGFQHFLQVYGRAGEACRRCGGTIERLVQGQRGTFLCPGCQR